jgi:hypothetical protein
VCRASLLVGYESLRIERVHGEFCPGEHSKSAADSDVIRVPMGRDDQSNGVEAETYVSQLVNQDRQVEVAVPARIDDRQP